MAAAVAVGPGKASWGRGSDQGTSEPTADCGGSFGESSMDATDDRAGFRISGALTDRISFDGPKEGPHDDSQSSPGTMPTQAPPCSVGHVDIGGVEPLTPRTKKKLDKRPYVVREVIDTESRYVNGLQKMESVFLKCPNSPIPDSTKSVIFRNLRSLIVLNGQLLRQLQSAGVDGDVGAVLKNFAPYLKLYKDWVSGQSDALQAIHDLEKAPAAFSCVGGGARFSAWLESKHTEAGESLDALLITPIQRIPRYQLLLEELLKNSIPSMPEHGCEDLQEALRGVKEVAGIVNEAAADIARVKKLIAIEAQIVDLPYKLVAPGRVLLLEDTMWKVCRRANKEFRFWLFNDMLVYGHELVPGARVYRHHHSFPLFTQQGGSLVAQEWTEPVSNDIAKSNFVDKVIQRTSGRWARKVRIGQSQVPLGYTFVIATYKKSFVVLAPTLDCKQRWLDTLPGAVRRETQRSLRRDSAKHNRPLEELQREAEEMAKMAPVWKPDASIHECSQCSRDFHLVNRRHHCRLCGEIFCGKCSRWWLHTRLGEVRCCSACYSREQHSRGSVTIRGLGKVTFEMQRWDRDEAGPWFELLAVLTVAAGNDQPGQIRRIRIGDFEEFHKLVRQRLGNLRDITLPPLPLRPHAVLLAHSDAYLDKKLVSLHLYLARILSIPDVRGLDLVGSFLGIQDLMDRYNVAANRLQFDAPGGAAGGSVSWRPCSGESGAEAVLCKAIRSVVACGDHSMLPLPEGAKVWLLGQAEGGMWRARSDTGTTGLVNPNDVVLDVDEAGSRRSSLRLEEDQQSSRLSGRVATVAEEEAAVLDERVAGASGSLVVGGPVQTVVEESGSSMGGASRGSPPQTIAESEAVAASKPRA
eukprot:CAMPEP_0204355744 /NCGR_PEP_ID=MMETSP0469-20131031/34395_1 /ASSEMBLY_ACC=CAM_ASM_000384 /TAXON_ID=2969 /ORGANISM="Oxyrrhis marina" /LENGTH=863 /DNA_ID=CAMNT_0051343067 /DNA_START=1 /DNA_END=2592 /DNA_ORIENTATION=+